MKSGKSKSEKLVEDFDMVRLKLGIVTMNAHALPGGNIRVISINDQVIYLTYSELEFKKDVLNPLKKVLKKRDKDCDAREEIVKIHLLNKKIQAGLKMGTTDDVLDKMIALDKKSGPGLNVGRMVIFNFRDTAYYYMVTKVGPVVSEVWKIPLFTDQDFPAVFDNEVLTDLLEDILDKQDNKKKGK